jgi:hypothetical protein
MNEIEIGTRDQWQNKIENIEKPYSFNLGYKLLYCPWATIETATHAFVSLNPAKKTPFDAEMRCVSEERGNSYIVERHTTKSPITEQFILLTDLLAISPENILTGVAHPFRSDDWNHFNSVQKQIGLELGFEFWKKVLDQGKITTVIISGTDISNMFVEHMGARFETKLASGWGRTSLTRHRTQSDIEIISLPHLSRFKLLSRSACYNPLKEIFKICPA